VHGSGCEGAHLFCACRFPALKHPSSNPNVSPSLQNLSQARAALSHSGHLSNSNQEGNGVDLIFHSNTESGKTDDLASDSDVNLAFLTSSGEWASISGKASISTDRADIKKYYSPALKAWIGDLGDGTHDGGPEDPRICLIRVKAVMAQYAISKSSMVGSLIEVAKGVATGDVPNINKLRHLGEAEVAQCRSLP
jgi:general stress protein 26